MNKMIATAIALAASLAGCATADEPAVERTSSLETAAASPGAATGDRSLTTNISEAAPVALYLMPDGTIGFTPPSAEGTRPLGVPVNGPIYEDDAYPSWTMKLDRDVVLPAAMPVRVFATSTTASLAGNTLPVFADSPGLIVLLENETMGWSADLPGPTLVTTGEVAEFSGALDNSNATLISAGSALKVTIIAIYSSEAAAAEFTFVMGPDHPTGIGT